MGLFDGLRRGRQISRATEALRSGAALEALENLDARALVTVADRLADLALLGRALEVARHAALRAPESWDALAAAAHYEQASGNHRAAIELLRTLSMRDPKHEAVARTLAELLTAEGEADKAVRVVERFRESADPRLHLALARAQFAAGDSAAAAQTLEPIVAAMQRVHFVSEGLLDLEEVAELTHLHEAAVAESRGAEQVVVGEAKRGNLLAHAGVNYRLLAGALMVKSERVAPSLELLTPEATRRLGEERLQRQPSDPVGLCQLAIAALREGSLDSAQTLFTQLREVDPSHFAGMLGYGATLDAQNKGWRRLARKLPDPVELPADLLPVVPDWEALTELERRVVLASIHPLRRFLPALVQEGCAMRILPIDARMVDLPELDELEAERGEDHRAYAALDGLTSHGLACAKIEDLLDVSPQGWTFAHEFAHLVHPALPDPVQAEIVRLHQAACERGYEVTEYQLKNEHEFFAVAYTDWLVQRLALQPLDAVLGELAAEVFALLDTLTA